MVEIGLIVSEEKIFFKFHPPFLIPKVEKDNGEIVTDQKELLKEVQYFYENLYKNKDEDKGCSLKDIVEGLKGASTCIRKLTEEEKDNLEGEIGSFEAGWGNFEKDEK